MLPHDVVYVAVKTSTSISYQVFLFEPDFQEAVVALKDIVDPSSMGVPSFIFSLR